MTDLRTDVRNDAPSDLRTRSQLPIRWGILGTGFIARTKVADLSSNGFIVAAVGSRSMSAAAEFAAEFSIPTAHGSYAELVADPQVDAVYIATPHPFHAENALLALRAGKHVLIEKAFTINSAEARQVIDTATELGLVAMEAMWTRFLPHMVRIRELIAAGTIGEVRTVFADHNQKLPSDPQHRINNPELGGGALLDLGIYPVSFAFDILGTPETINATAAKTDTGVDRQTAILFGYQHGQQAVLHCALDTAGPNRATVIGTAGYIEIDRVWYTPTSFTVYDSDNQPIEKYVSTVTSRGMQFQAWEFERRIRVSRDGTDSAHDAVACEILPPAESVAIMQALDTIRAQVGLVYPGER